MKILVMCLGAVIAMGIAGCGTDHPTGSDVVQLAEGSSPGRIVSDGTWVYWVDSSAGTVSSGMRRVPSRTLFQNPSSSPSAIAVDGDTVFWASDQGLYRVASAGGSPTTLATWNSGQPEDLHAGSGHLYWTDSALRGLFAMDENTPGSPRSLSPGQLPLGVTVTDANVYWADMSAATVNAIAVAGGPAWTVVLGQGGSSGGPCYVAADDVAIYWTDDAQGTVNSMALTGGPPTVLASGQSNPLGIAVDGQNVYWADPEAGAVFKTLKAGGGAALTVAQDDGGPSTLTLDATYVYWTDSNGQVMSAVK